MKSHEKKGDSGTGPRGHRKKWDPSCTFALLGTLFLITGLVPHQTNVGELLGIVLGTTPAERRSKGSRPGRERRGRIMQMEQQRALELGWPFRNGLN